MKKFHWLKWQGRLLLVAVLILSAFAIVFIRAKVAQPFSLIHRFIAPLQRAVTKIRGLCDDFSCYIRKYNDFQEERRNLLARIDELEKQLSFQEGLYQENIRLRRLLMFPPLAEYDYLGSRVIGFSGDNWRKGLIIARGSTDGVREKMPVITYNGYLVGYIKETYATTSHVLLVTDPSFVVGGLVQGEGARDLGIVRGLPWGEGLYTMDNLPWDASVGVGDIVVTSGFSDIFPKDIPIGEIIRVDSGDYGLTQQAALRFYISDESIEEVLVIVGQGERE